MPNTITFSVVNSSNKEIRKYTCLTEEKSYVNSIITIGKNNTIKEANMNKLIEVAKRSGDAGVIEQSDLNGEQKKNLALANDFGDYYDISVSKDGKYLQVKIKKTMIDPNLADIKSDFGVRNDVFVQKDNIPHGNGGVIPSSSYGAGYDSITIKAGETLNIPVSEINIDGKPRNFAGRFLSWLTH